MADKDPKAPAKAAAHFGGAAAHDETAPENAAAHEAPAAETSVAPAPAPGASGKKKASKGTWALRVLLVVLLLIVAGGVGYMVWEGVTMHRAAEEQNNTPVPENPVPAADSAEPQKELPDNPIDFSQWQAKNSEIYAWIYVPGTNINLPVLQHPDDDMFYLRHDINGQYDIEGSIFSQSHNKKDFSDPVTVLYGHNFPNETMFTQLHRFENPDFFKEHREFYIYTPGKIYTYKVVSAYVSDNRHILNSYDFTDINVTQQYFDSVADPVALIKNTSGDKLDAATDKIVQLSTCCTGEDHTRRFLVTGALESIQDTK